MSSDQQRLEHIFEAIELIEKYAVRGKDEFRKNELIQNWVVRHLQIIGEAASKISLETKKQSPSTPWKEITGMRHVLVHDYFEIDIDRVWNVVDDHLGELKSTVQSLLKNSGGETKG